MWIVAVRWRPPWSCTLTGLGSNSHLSQNVISTVIRLQLMKMSFSFSVSWFSKLFWVLINWKFIFISGGYNHKSESLQSVWLGKMTRLGLKWSKGPDLLLSRDGHRSITVGNQIYHIGGDGKMWGFSYSRLFNYFLIFRKIEKWTIEASGITKELLDLELNEYWFYPEIFIISYDYCKYWKFSSINLLRKFNKSKTLSLWNLKTFFFLFTPAGL